MYRTAKAIAVFTLMTLSSVYAASYAASTQAVYSISYDSRFDGVENTPFIQKFFFRYKDEFSVSRDFSVGYTLQLEQERHAFLDHDNSILTPEFRLDFNFKKKGSFKTFSFTDRVIETINTTDSLNQYVNKTRYDMKFKTDGVLAYEREFNNLSLSVAYGTPKVEKDPYKKGQQSDFMVQKTFASSVGYQCPIFNTGINFHSAMSYSKYPLLTQTKHESKVDSYAHYATALTYGDKEYGSYFAFMHNRRDVVMTERKNADYFIEGTEFIYSYSFNSNLKFKTGYEHFYIENDRNMSSEVSVVPIEMLFSFNPQFNIWFQARLCCEGEFEKHKSLKTFNEEFEGYDGNSYAVGSEFRF